jgi:hypothetical protein
VNTSPLLEAGRDQSVLRAGVERRDTAAAQQDRGNEGAGLVDRIRLDEGGGESLAALEEEAGDLTPAELGEGGRDAVGEDGLGAGLA